MNRSRRALLCVSFVLMANAGCTRTLPDEGSLAVSSDTLTVAGGYKRVALDSVERVSIGNGKLVVHGPSDTVAVDLPPNADAGQKNRGWALVTEAEGDHARSLTFTQETSLEDFTISVPPSDGQVAYGSLGGRDGNDVLLFAYGSGSKSYWGWATITRPANSTK